MAKSAAAIEVRDLVKVYGHGQSAVRALDHISLSIDDNAFFTLLGPSGCGKTTLLRIIAGFEEVTGGLVYLFGDEIKKLPPNRRPINTVFQHYALFPHMSVAENVAFGLERLNRPQAEIADTVSRMLDLVKLDHLHDRRPSQLSGGQQQRVALARALAPQPRLLLLDEPLSALDLKLRQKMRVELKQLQEQTGITFIFVTHDQDEALTMSDRIAVMSDGEVQQVGTPQEIYQMPENRFVASFIGQTNLIDVDVEAARDGRIVGRMTGGVRLEASASCLPRVGCRATVSLRPEQIKFADTGHRCIIERATYLGTDTEYAIRLHDQSRLLVRVQNDRTPAGVGASQQTFIQFDAGAARLLID